MWYLIAGNLMSLIVYLTFTNFLLDLQDLNIYQRFICWFFIEHLQDDCNFSAGKFFLTDIDFRTLIKNVLIISRNFIFLAQALRPLEFFILNILLIALFIYNKYGNFNTYSIYVNSFIFFCYRTSNNFFSLPRVNKKKDYTSYTLFEDILFLVS